MDWGFRPQAPPHLLEQDRFIHRLLQVEVIGLFRVKVLLRLVQPGVVQNPGQIHCLPPGR